MKKRKIRGHRRRWKKIDNWVEACKQLDMDYLQERQRDYVKMWVSPWSNISVTGSEIPAPRGKTRRKFLQGLIAIYDAWKQQLDALGQPYYLRIWLYEPRFDRSQVVCAIGDFLHFYEQTFYAPEQPATFHPANWGKMESALSQFSWECRLDEDTLLDDDLMEPEYYGSAKDYEAEKRWFLTMIRKAHRVESYSGADGEPKNSYAFKQGYVWLGSK